jgi:hypothetical protein
MSNRPLDALNSLFCSFLAIYLPRLPTTVSDIGRFRVLALTDYSHRLSFLVFLIIRLIEPLLQLNHWFLISGLFFMCSSSVPNVKFATIFHFQFSFHMLQTIFVYASVYCTQTFATPGRMVSIPLSLNPCVLDSCYAQFYLLTYSKPHFNCLQSVYPLQYFSGQTTLPKRITHFSHKQNIKLCGHDQITTLQKRKLIFSSESLTFIYVTALHFYVH